MDLTKTKKSRKDKISSPPLAMNVDFISPRIHYVGRGLPFQAKFIGQCEINEQRGDEFCVEAMTKLKSQIQSTRQHKKRIEILLQWNHIQVLEEKTYETLHIHQIGQISFVWKDPADNRALGMIVVQTDEETKLTQNIFFAYKTKGWALMVMTEIQKLFEEKAKEASEKPISSSDPKQENQLVEDKEESGNDEILTEKSKDDCLVVNLLDLTVEDKPVETIEVDPWTGTKSTKILNSSQFHSPEGQMDIFNCGFSFPVKDSNINEMIHNDDHHSHQHHRPLIMEMDPFLGETMQIIHPVINNNPTSNPFTQSTTYNLNPFAPQGPPAMSTIGIFDKTDSVQLLPTTMKDNNNKKCQDDPFSDLISIELLNVQKEKPQPIIQENVKKPSLMDLKREQLAANMKNSDDFRGGQN